MRIVSWNCNGGLRRKVERLDALKADILIVQECESPDTHAKQYKDWAGDYIWIGSNKNKGLGVFARNGVKLARLDWRGSFAIEGFKNAHPSHQWTTDELELFLPVRVNDQFNILAVWTKSAPVFRYIGQFWKYLQIHDEDIQSSDALIIGDFNSNKIWDKSDRWWNHSDVVSELANLNIYSLYHYQQKEEQGSESAKTYYMYRHAEKGYHIDYAFVSEVFLGHLRLEMAPKEDFIDISDHIPLIIDSIS